VTLSSQKPPLLSFSQEFLLISWSAYIISSLSRELEAQVMRWESTAQRALDENQFLREQLEHKSALFVGPFTFSHSSAVVVLTETHVFHFRLLRLEAQVGAIQEQVGGSTHFRTMLSTLNHELALWSVRLCERTERAGAKRAP